MPVLDKLYELLLPLDNVLLSHTPLLNPRVPEVTVCGTARKFIHLIIVPTFTVMLLNEYPVILET